MLRMSKLSDYSLQVMAHMARSPEDLFKARELADQTGVALPTVSKLLKALLKSELLKSWQGAKGGYSLTRSPEQISVAEIISAIEGGPVGITECATQPGTCDQESNCSVRGGLQRINDVIRDALEGVTLEEIARFDAGSSVEVGLTGLRIN